MSELQADEDTARYVRARARAAGVSESDWLARHFRDTALRESAALHAAWYAERPGLLEDEVMASAMANDEADAV